MADKAPPERLLLDLASWRPPRGVISVYLRTDPADRREGWRVELRDGLKQLAAGARGEGGDHRPAVRRAAERILSRFPEGRHPPGRCQVGFVEASDADGREMWRSLQIAPRRTMIVHRGRPFLRPLVELLDDGSPVGVVAVSAERVRLLEWSLGVIEEAGEWEPEFMKPTWRERRAPMIADAARGHAVSAAGKDQLDQRLEANRERFLEEAGREVAAKRDLRRWRLLLAYGDKGQIDRLTRGLGPRPELRVAEERNIVHEERQAIAARVEQALERVNRERELELVERAKSAALSSEGRGSLGLAETARALREGRVDHLLLSAERGVDALEPDRPPDAGNGGAPLVQDAAVGEQLIEQALLTSARVTPVEGDAAAALAQHGGVAALLRY